METSDFSTLGVFRLVWLWPLSQKLQRKLASVHTLSKLFVPSLVGSVQVCVIRDQCDNWRCVVRWVHCLIGQMALSTFLSDAVAFKQNTRARTKTTRMHRRSYRFLFCLRSEPPLPKINLHLFVWMDAWRFVRVRASVSILEVPSGLHNCTRLCCCVSS